MERDSERVKEKKIILVMLLYMRATPTINPKNNNEVKK